MRLLQNLVFLALVIVMAPVALLGFVCKAASIAFRVGGDAVDRVLLS